MTLYYPPTKDFVQTTLAATLSAGVTASATLGSSASTLGLQNKAGIAIIDRVDANGTATPTKAEVVSFAGTSGSTVTTLVRGLGGTTDAEHAVGAVVEFGPDAIWAQGLIDVIDAEHGTDGTHDTATVALIAGNQTFTGIKTFTTGLLKAVDITSGSGVNTLPTSSQTLVGRTTTDTLTNKRITKREGTSASAATHTIDSDSYDIYTVTAQAEAVAFGAPTGTPTQGQTLVIRIKDNATARAISWNGIFRAGDIALPTTTVLSKTLYCGFMYNSTDTKWDLLAVCDNV